MMPTWETSLYKFTLARRQIIVDVTWSCPNFAVPTPGIPDLVSELRQSGRKRILDFGAGRLRNSLYLLSQRADFQVTAVEFEKCFQTPLGQKRLAEAGTYPSFFFKTWPHEFLKASIEVDAVLLVNVVNVIPAESDRRRVIRECSRRLRKGGWLVWMSHYGEPNYKPGATKRLKGPDGGWFYGLDKTHQTYSKQFEIPEIKTYFTPQYHEVRKLSAGHNHAFVFEKL